MIETSETLYARAETLIPGGVNSPVRAFKGVGGTPIYFERGQGAYLHDVDGNDYIDYVASWGPLICGHADPIVQAALRKQLDQGLGFGAPTKHALDMAQCLINCVPSIESVRMVNSGTEATMSAIRLARGFTGRNKIIKFEGCYHGHVDSLLVKAGSGLLTLGIPGTPGVPSDFTQHTLTANFNDLESVAALFNEYGDDIAAVILEPVAGNMGTIAAHPEFLAGLRTLCDQRGSLLIFDEVMSGFRVARGGAQELFQVTPDLTTLGKIIGGGLPVGAFGGRADIMAHMAPAGPVYQAGTLSGNPMALTAGLATLQQLCDADPYPMLAAQTEHLITGLKQAAAHHQIPLVINQVGSMFSLFFTDATTVESYQDVMRADATRYQQFFHGMLQRGIYFAPSAYETAFLSTTHEQAEIDKTVAAADAVMASL